MLGLFRKRAVNVDAVLECSVREIGVYLDNGDVSCVKDAFAMLNVLVQEESLDEHIRLQLKPVLNKFNDLYGGIGVYDGFLYTACQVINYCLLYIRVGGCK